MALSKRNLRRLAVSVSLSLFGATIVLQNSDKLLSISGVRGVNVIGLTAGGALCGTALAGIIANLVVGRAARDQMGAGV
jgi:hypothetical protein